MMMTEEEEKVTSTLLAELITSLEEATLMAKKLPNTTDPTNITRIHSTLHSAHYSLSLYLAHHSLRLPPPSFRFNNNINDDDEDDDMEEDIESVETSMRACFIQNKRPKRRLSPQAAADVEEDEVRRRVAAATEEVFDPAGSKLRALDLIHQFHG